jgi:hypothetical protein
MASGLRRAIRQAILDHLLGTSPWTAPAHIWVGLFTTAPTQTTAGTEVAAADYGRVQHDTWHAATAAEPSVATNDGAIEFATAESNWGAIVAFGIFDAETNGNLLGYGSCSKTINTADTARFLDEALSVRLNYTA